jgi:hypothetical protein
MTPLNSILNLSEMLIFQNQMMQEEGGATVSVPADMIQGSIDSLKVINSSTNMMKLMNQSLLDKQAILEGSLKLQYKVMQPKKAVEDLLEYFFIQI